MRAKAGDTSLDVSEGEDEDEEDSDEEIDEELGFISPLDSVDPYVTFKMALTSMLYTSSPFTWIQLDLNLVLFSNRLPDEELFFVPSINNFAWY